MILYVCGGFIKIFVSFQDIIAKLVQSLREEYRGRSPYIAYLVRSRQGLLANMASLDTLCARMEIEQRMSTRFLITVCVR